MKKALILSGLVIFVWSCKSSHKLSKMNHIDLTESSYTYSEDYPKELADSLAWFDLVDSKLGRKEKEVIRIWINSWNEPNIFISITKTKKGAKGESVFYWRLNSSNSDVKHQQMKLFLRGRCSEVKRTDSYGYCIPKYQNQVNWEEVYNTLEQRGIWSAKGIDEIEVESLPEGNIWEMGIQLRVGNRYFRTYTHRNPEKYRALEDGGKAYAIATTLQQVPENYEPSTELRTFRGVTVGKRNSVFRPCGSSEQWSFDGNLEDIMRSKGMSIRIEKSDSTFFLIEALGVLNQNWYTSVGEQNFNKVFTIKDVGRIDPLSINNCPE